MTTREARKTAVEAYITAIRKGCSESYAAQEAWEAVRCPHERAPNWNRKWEANTGCRGSFRCPLGDTLDLGTGEFGYHCKNWPVTVQAMDECTDVSTTVLGYLSRAAARRNRNRKSRWDFIAATA
jgi:hypothetical protein